jgi:glycosyltransferase involved in cell wall biosynthesis
MRVALVHYWLLGNRGGEQVLEAICRLFPEADIFTLFYDPESVSPLIRSKVVHASALNPFRRVYRSLLPLMPMALESFDLRSYDLIISSESGPAKGIIRPSTARHVCYCHTPMRYLWELYPAYRHEFRSSVLSSLMMAPIASYLRNWDFSTASRVGAFFANSDNVRRRIWSTYRRQARVVYPPVAVETFFEKPAEDYFLIVSEMVPYKRLDYAISLFSRNGRKLKVVGDGPEHSKLRRLARSNVELYGRVCAADLRQLYARCSAFIMPGEEDFGMTMVEALASGKPVIALGRGGAREIVTTGRGVLYADPSEASLEEALRTFDQSRSSFEPSFLKDAASAFSESRFEENFLRGLAAYWSQSRQWHEPAPPVQAAPYQLDSRHAPERRVLEIRKSQRKVNEGPLM